MYPQYTLTTAKPSPHVAGGITLKNKSKMSFYVRRLKRSRNGA
jgi:hypothetical protein